MRTKQEIIEKLIELGIDSTNCYPKKTFLFNGEKVISMFREEFQDDFYFPYLYGKKLMKVKKDPLFEKIYQKDSLNGRETWIVPISCCEVVWEDKPLVEKEDVPFSQMTLRDYACIHLKIPDSQKEWLNQLIIKWKQEKEDS